MSSGKGETCKTLTRDSGHTSSLHCLAAPGKATRLDSESNSESANHPRATIRLVGISHPVGIASAHCILLAH